MCVQPIIIKNKKVGKRANKFTTPVPCGRCPNCVKARVNSWAFRINKELEISVNPLFVTLTYDEQNVPRTSCGLKTLRKTDVQKFLKRLRFHYEKHESKHDRSPLRLRYYLCGEYGSTTLRPHYHIILLNLPKYCEYLISDTWQHGFVAPLPLKDGSVNYVLKYMAKRKFDKKDKRLPEFSLMSKGLGANYLTPAIARYHHSSVQNSYVTLRGGIKMSMPKYYKEKLYDEAQREQVTVYLQNRAVHLQNMKLKAKIQKYPTINPKVLLKNLELEKLNVKFDKRLSEVL